MQNLPADALQFILTFACDQDAAFKRRFSVNHSWLEAHHGAHELWQNLSLITGNRKPLDPRLRCLYSAWAHAPAAVRAAAERHTRDIILLSPLNGDYIATGRYSLGAGLAGMQFQRLEMVKLHVFGQSSQSRDEDTAALAPLFDSLGLELQGHNSCRAGAKHEDDDYREQLRHDAGDENFSVDSFTPDRWCGSLLDERNMGLLTRLFHKVQRLELPPYEVSLIPSEEDLDVLCQNYKQRFLLAGKDEAAFKSAAVVDEETAGRLVEIVGLRLGREASGRMQPLPAMLLPNLKRLSLCESDYPLPEMASLFKDSATACPSLEMLIFSVDTEVITWRQSENYSVFALLPRTLVALVLVFEDVALPQPATASAFVRLIEAHVSWCGVHVVTLPSRTRRLRDGDILLNLDDDGVLPKPPWDIYPEFGATYSPEAYRRSSFQIW